jgi:hypothetical protein
MNLCITDVWAVDNSARPCSQELSSRLDCYRQLAHAILGPAAPNEDLALVRALAEHARLLNPAANITQIRPRRAA